MKNIADEPSPHRSTVGCDIGMTVHVFLFIETGQFLSLECDMLRPYGLADVALRVLRLFELKIKKSPLTIIPDLR